MAEQKRERETLSSNIILLLLLFSCLTDLLQEEELI